MNGGCFDLVYFTIRVPDTSDTSATQVRRECYTNDTSAIQVKNLDFDSDASENIFFISYMANENLQSGTVSFSELPFGNASFPCQNAIEPQKLNFVMAKAISNSYTLDCSCKCYA